MVTQQQIKALLLRNGWNQSQLAEACNVSQGTVSRWLQGTNPNPEQQDRLQQLINERIPTNANQPHDIPTGIELTAVLAAVEGSYHMLGLDQQEAAALLEIVLEVAAERPTPSAGPDFHRVLAETEVRKFLKSKQLLRDGA